MLTLVGGRDCTCREGTESQNIALSPHTASSPICKETWCVCWCGGSCSMKGWNPLLLTLHLEEIGGEELWEFRAPLWLSSGARQV